MAVTTVTLKAERWLDEVVFQGLVSDVAIAAISETFVLPTGFGDVAIMSCTFSILSVGTVPVTATAPRGITARISSSDGSTAVDILGTSPWYATGGVAAAFDRFEATVDPDSLTLWRQAELLTVNAPEMDAGATGDLLAIVKCVRVRPIESAARGPVRLVR